MSALKVVVVGGTGNISTAIVERLLQLGHQVTLFNRGQRGAAPAGVRVLTGDRRERDSFEAAMRREQFDAAIDMIGYSREDAESSLRAFPDVVHFVHCSTVCTYGVEYDWFPSTEDHPLRPTTDYGRRKRDADNVYLEAYYRTDYPVTILKPSTTYGPQMGLLRQIAWEFSWLDRIRRGKPVVVCGDGNALHQFLHIDDAALAFCGVLGRPVCLGQVYNVVGWGATTWRRHHQTAMRLLGQTVPLVGIPFDDLQRCAEQIPGFSICSDIFRHHTFYSGDKLRRDVPEFVPRVSLEQGMARLIEAHDRAGNIPNSQEQTWEDDLIARQRRGFCDLEETAPGATSQ